MYFQVGYHTRVAFEVMVCTQQQKDAEDDSNKQSMIFAYLRHVIICKFILSNTKLYVYVTWCFIYCYFNI